MNNHHLFSKTFAEFIIRLSTREDLFQTLTKRLLSNSNIFASLNLLSAFLQISDDESNSRRTQITEYLVKLFYYNDFSNFFLIDLLIQWILETCVHDRKFLFASLERNKELLSTVSKFNKKIYSIESIKENGIIFSVENLGYLNRLENSHSNKAVNQILYQKYKNRSKIISKLSKKDQVEIPESIFKDYRQIRNFLVTDSKVFFQEETFYRVPARIIHIYRFHVIVSVESGKKDSTGSIVCGVPFDHPCIIYQIH